MDTLQVLFWPPSHCCVLIQHLLLWGGSSDHATNTKPPSHHQHCALPDGTRESSWGPSLLTRDLNKIGNSLTKHSLWVTTPTLSLRSNLWGLLATHLCTLSFTPLFQEQCPGISTGSPYKSMTLCLMEDSRTSSQQWSQF